MTLLYWSLPKFTIPAVRATTDLWCVLTFEISLKTAAMSMINRLFRMIRIRVIDWKTKTK